MRLTDWLLLGFLGAVLMAEISVVVASRYALGGDRRIAHRWYGLVGVSLVVACIFGGIVKWLTA